MKIRNLAALSAVVLVVAAASPAFAQRADGPYSGIFGGPPDVNRWQGLDLHGSMFGAWDENVFPALEDTTQLDPRLRQSGASVGVAGSLDYVRRGDQTQFALDGGVDARKYFSDPDLVTAYHAATSFTTNLTPRVAFSAGGGATYSPFFQFAPFLGAGIGDVGPLTGNLGFAALAERNVALDGTVGVTDNITARTSLTVSAAGRDWELLDHPQNNLRAWGGRAGIHHNLTRNFGVHVAYGADKNEYASPGVASYIIHTIDVGADYGKTLEFARRTAFSFSTSSGITRFDGTNHFRLNGDARLTRGFQRSWSAWLGYDRTLEFLVAFHAPLLADSVSAGIGGLSTTRLKLSAGAGYTRGTIGFSGADFQSYSGVTRADVAVTRHWALFGQYIYYHYEVPAGSSALALVPRYSRQVVMGGLTLWLPLINDVRAPK